MKKIKENFFGMMDQFINSAIWNGPQIKTTAVANDALLKNGMVTTPSGMTINLNDLSEKSVEGVVIDRVDSLSDNSALDGNGSSSIKTTTEDITTLPLFKLGCMRAKVFEKGYVDVVNIMLQNKAGIDGNTIVYVATKKHPPKMGYSNDNIIGILGAHSNLPLIYSKISDRWTKTVASHIDDEFSYVLYIPDIRFYVPSNEKSGCCVTDKLQKFNLLIVLTPTAKSLMTEADKKPNHKDAIMTMVSDACKSIAYLGCKVVRFDPFSDQYFKKHPIETVDAWVTGINREKYKNTVQETIVHLPNMTDYICFNGSLRQHSDK